MILTPVWTVVLVLAVVTFTDVNRASTRTVSVELSDSAGLFVGNDVGVLGVPIGQVSSITPSGDKVIVKLRITDAAVRLPSEASAVVVARSVAADRYVEITPVYTAGPTLRNGATIPLRRTATPVDFDEVLGSLKKVGDDLAADPGSLHHLNGFIDAAADTLGGQGQSINQTTKALSAAVGRVTDQRQTLVGSIRSLADLTSTLARHEQDVRVFVDNLAAAADLLADERFSIGAALTSLQHAIDQLGTVAEEHDAALREDVRGLTKVLQNTLESKQDLAQLLEALPLASQNLNRAISPDGRTRVQLDPLSVTPAAPVTNELCEALPQLCALVSVPPTLGSVLDLLGLRPEAGS